MINKMTKAELDEILHSYHWIKIKIFKPENYVTWEEKYQALEQHHLAETEFLIAKIRELAKDLLAIANS